MSSFNVQSILSDLHIRYSIYCAKDSCDTRIKNVAAINKAANNDLTFCSSDEPDKVCSALAKTNAKVILCNNLFRNMLFENKVKTPTTQPPATKVMTPIMAPKQHQCLIFVGNPRLAFIRIMKKMFVETDNTKYYSGYRINSNSDNNKKGKKGIGLNITAALETSKTIIVSETTSIGRNCKIGYFSKIGNNCQIGDNVVIGDRVIIEQNTAIGNNCSIQPGTVIGADGFSYERNERSLDFERFPHIGGVKVGDNVEVSANCSIARGSLSDTIIGDGTKLDALVHIAHNVEIGRNCALTAGTVIGGSTKIGDTCWGGLNCTIKHKLRIGSNVIIGSGSSVINDIPDKDIVAGVPAKSIKHKVKSKQLFLMSGLSRIG